MKQVLLRTLTRTMYQPLLMLVKGPSFSVKLWLNSGPRFGKVGLSWSMLASLSSEVVHQSSANAFPLGSGLPLFTSCNRSASTFLFASNKSWISRSFVSLNILNWRLTVSLSGWNINGLHGYGTHDFNGQKEKHDWYLHGTACLICRTVEMH